MLLPDIVERAKQYWEYTYFWKQPLKPKFKVICHFCGNEMVFHWYRVHKRQYKNPKAHPYRIDIGFKCMNCFHLEVFGVPVDEDYWNFISNEVYKHTGHFDIVVNAVEVIE